MIDSKQLLKKFGGITECEIEEASPELTDIKSVDISEKFPCSFSLYKHQVAAVEAIKGGSNLLLSAGTNSGKTEAAFLSICSSIEKGVAAQALFIYPIKALAADQKLRLEKYSQPYGWNICVFDADNQSRYQEIGYSELVLTNPHMLLVRLKNQDETLLKNLRNVRFIILDEIHCYTAYQINLLFAMIKFMQESLKIDFQLILLSATVGNPEEINQTLLKLFNRNSVIVTGRAKNPPTKIYLLSSINSRILYNSNFPENEIAIKLIEKYADDNCSTLVFNDTRKDAAMIGHRAHSIVGDSVAIHYGSLEKDERTKNEQDFRNGKIPVMVTVKTLQQGIDIGSVQRIIHVGLPFKQTDFWQRQGRMGRRAEIQKCESIILPSPKVPFDMFIVAEKDRFQEFMTKRIEKVLLKSDSKIIRMFMGCMKVKNGIEIETKEAEFLKSTRLIAPASSFANFFNKNQSTYALSSTGQKFLYQLNFYTGNSVKVKDMYGIEIPIGNTSLTEIQPNCILFNNNIRDPQFYVVKDLDLSRQEAIVVPIEDEFDTDECTKIKNWSMFSQTSIDFSMTNPDSTFGNIILKPSGVLHLEYVVGVSSGKRRRILRVINEFDDVHGQDDFLSNYVLSELPPSLLKQMKKDLKDAAVIGVIIEAAFSCIRNGLRSKFDIAYDEFAHLLSVDDEAPKGNFIFYETSCNDTIRDVNWIVALDGAKDFLKFVQERDEAGLFYLRGSHGYFKIINDYKEDVKKKVYQWIEKSIFSIVQEITRKLDIAKKVTENEKDCKDSCDKHSYLTVCKNVFHELVNQNPDLKSIYSRLLVFYVDDYLECGLPLQNITIGASRSSRIENRYVMFLSVPALKDLSERAIAALILHELTHLLNIESGRPFQNKIEEELSVQDSVRKQANVDEKIRLGTEELYACLEKVQKKGKYSLNELLTIGGTIIENLRWEKVRGIKHLHWFRSGDEYHYHELS